MSEGALYKNAIGKTSNSNVHPLAVARNPMLIRTRRDLAESFRKQLEPFHQNATSLYDVAEATTNFVLIGGGSVTDRHQVTPVTHQVEEGDHPDGRMVGVVLGLPSPRR